MASKKVGSRRAKVERGNIVRKMNFLSGALSRAELDQMMEPIMRKHFSPSVVKMLQAGVIGTAKGKASKKAVARLLTS